MADTDIKLSVDLDVVDAEKTAEQLQKEIEGIFKSRKGQSSAQLTNLETQMKKDYNAARDLIKQMEKLADMKMPLTDEVEKFSEALNKSATGEEFIQALDKFSAAKLPTEEYQRLYTEFVKLEEESGKLQQKEDELIQAGETSGKTWDKLQSKIEEVGTRYREVRADIVELVKTNQAYTDGINSTKYTQMQTELDKVNDKMKQQIIHYDELSNKARKTGVSVKKSASDMGAGFSKGTSVVVGNLKTMTKRFIALAFGVRGMFALFRKLRTAIIEGFKELSASKLTPLTEQIKALKGSLTTLRNSFASAFEPIITTVVPYIQILVDALTQAIDKLAQFIAAMSGQTTYIKAIKKTGDEVEKAGDKAKGSLASFDKLNVITTDKGAGGGTSKSFEETGIAPSVLSSVEKLRDIVKQIRDFANETVIQPFKQSFKLTFDAKGIDKITKNLERIRAAVKAIVTDSRLKAIRTTISGIASMLGTVAGSIANIALVIGQLFSGALAQFLEDNGNSIIIFIQTMCGLIDRLTTDISELFVALSVILAPLAGDAAINIIATALGIIFDAVSGLKTLGLDILISLFELFVQPIVDNANGFATALQGILDILSPLIDTVRSFIDDVLSGVFVVWEQIKGIIDEVKTWLSELLGVLLDWWNNGPGPMLAGWAEDIKAFYTNYIKPVIDELFGLLGDLVSYLSDILKPVLNAVLAVIQWFLDNIWPSLQAVLQTAWDILVGLGEFIAKFVETVISTVRFLFGAIKDILTGDFKGLFTRATEWFSKRKEDIVKILENVKLRFQKIFEGIKNIFSNLGKAIIAVFDVIKGAIKKPINLIMGCIEALVNAVIKGINFMIGALNKLSFDVPDWVPIIGGEKFGFNIKEVKEVSLPRLAQGTVVPPNMSEFLAVLGDNNKETEIVSPLSTIKKALQEVMAQQNINVTFQVEGDPNGLFKVIQKESTRYNQRTGSSAFA